MGHADAETLGKSVTANGALALGATVGSVAGLLDGLITICSDFQGNRGALVMYSWALSVGVCSAVALCQWAWCWLGRPLLRVRTALFVTWASLPLAALTCWVPTSWITSHWRGLSSLERYLAAGSYLFLGCGALAVGFTVWRGSLLFRKPQADAPATQAVVRLRYGLLVAALLLATVSYLADRRVLVGLYEDFHYGLMGLSLLSLSAALVLVNSLVHSSAGGNASARLVQLQRSAPWAPSVVWGAALVAVLAFETWPPNVFGPSGSLVFQKLIASARTQTDFDHDGASALFGGTDCAGFDPSRAPHRFDFPGNRKDEDCSGQDNEWPVLPQRPTYPIPEAKGFNVLFVTVDALRADHVGSYGYARNTTPSIDALAQRSVRFAKAFSPSSKTFGSLPALQSGLYPSNVPRDNAKTAKAKTDNKRLKKKLFGITSDAPMLAELFQAQGYTTATFLSGPSLLLLGLDRGFATATTATTGTERVEESIAAFAAQPRPFYHWLHLSAPHAPYEAHPEHPFGDSDVDRYDSEIASDDAGIGRLLKALQTHGLDKNTIVIVSADHGEEFRDHGGQFHSFQLYRELIHVPLIIHIPGVAARVVNAPVETLGIAATLCELLSLTPGCDQFDGRSLLPEMTGHEDDWGAYSELVKKGGQRQLQSLYTREWHIIRDYQRDRIELYDVVRDPNEQKNVAANHPEVTRGLLEQLTRRPLVRAGRVFREYQRTKDLQVVATGLPALQNPAILPYAFKLLAKERRRFQDELAQLKDRPGLPPELRKRAVKYAQAAKAAESASTAEATDTATPAITHSAGSASVAVPAASTQNQH